MYSRKDKERLFDCIIEQIKHVNDSNTEAIKVIQESYNEIIGILKDEIKGLKKDNNDLLDRLMSYAPDELHTYKQVKNYEKMIEQPKITPSLGDVVVDRTTGFAQGFRWTGQDIPAETKEEIEQKQAAGSQIAAIMGQ